MKKGGGNNKLCRFVPEKLCVPSPPTTMTFFGHDTLESTNTAVTDVTTLWCLGQDCGK